MKDTIREITEEEMIEALIELKGSDKQETRVSCASVNHQCRSCGAMVGLKKEYCEACSHKQEYTNDGEGK